MALAGTDVDFTDAFDCVFWFGDLNYRVAMPFDSAMQLIADYRSSKLSTWGPLHEHDQLRAVRASGAAFAGFEEAMPQFAPTFKRLVQYHTLTYDEEKRRTPSVRAAAATAAAAVAVAAAAATAAN